MTPAAVPAASDAKPALAAGSLSSVQLVQACLARIRAREPAVQAWQFLDEEYALEQARARDAERAAGHQLGLLHGIPVAIKDIIDTADMPTENGSVLHAGRRPGRDATVVAALRAAGAVILGKTVSTEFATYAPGKTRNPHDPARTPGGSSSGSAAAVADGMVPLAIGSQTNASIVRPASYCGIYGFKPSLGLIPRAGVLELSPTLDSVGLFARCLDDLALFAEALAGVDAADFGAGRRACHPFVQTLHSVPSRRPRFAFVKTAVWERADAPTRAALAGLAEALGAQCEEVVLPEASAEAWAWHRTIMESEMAAQLDAEWQHGRERLSASLREQLGRGREILALDYQQALVRRGRLIGALAPLFARFDAILTPATGSTAPALESTGDPSFGTLWSLCNLPAISLPLLKGHDGLPLGVQLVGAPGDDMRLLRHARCLEADWQAHLGAR